MTVVPNPGCWAADRRVQLDVGVAEIPGRLCYDVTWSNHFDAELLHIAL